MARAGILITLTIKLRSPIWSDNVNDLSIACCLTSKRIPYICYLWANNDKNGISMGWQDVVYPYLRIHYTRKMNSIYFCYGTITIEFFGYKNVGIFTSLCDIGLCKYDSDFYVTFNYVGISGITNTDMNNFRSDLTELEKQIGWNNKYEFAKTIHQLLVKYRL